MESYRSQHLRLSMLLPYKLVGIVERDELFREGEKRKVTSFHFRPNEWEQEEGEEKRGKGGCQGSETQRRRNSEWNESLREERRPVEETGGKLAMVVVLGS